MGSWARIVSHKGGCLADSAPAKESWQLCSRTKTPQVYEVIIDDDEQETGVESSSGKTVAIPEANVES